MIFPVAFPRITPPAAVPLDKPVRSRGSHILFFSSLPLVASALLKTFRILRGRTSRVAIFVASLRAKSENTFAPNENTFAPILHFFLFLTPSFSSFLIFILIVVF